MRTEPSLVLHGRRSECQVLDDLVAAARAGESQVLVLRGEPGIGKSALLEYVAQRAAGCRIARAAGVESEMELAFAGLHQLLAPMLDRLDHLPGPQRDAVLTAFGLRGGEPPNRFLVALAALGLLAETAEDAPLVCLVDDAQWFDRESAQALAFVARRLMAESMALVFAARDRGEGRDLAGLPELAVAGLGDRDARALLDAVVRGPLDERVRERLLAEAGGNPLALLELPQGLPAAELAGGFGLPDARAVSGQIEASYARRWAALHDDARQLLLVAAAEPLGEPLLVWAAAERLGIDVPAAASADAAGLLELGVRVRFRHPLVRSAVYRAASSKDRRCAHRALAEVTDPDADPERRAWHRAQAAAGPDEEVARELERSAGRARTRGGFAAAAAFLEQAAALSGDVSRRAERALAAASAKHLAGAPDAALELLRLAEAGPLDELGRAQVDLLRGQIALVWSGGDAPPLLLKAARRLEPIDAELARATYRDAFQAALFAGRVAQGVGLVEVAEAARTAPASSDAPSACDLLIRGRGLLITDGYAAGAPMLQQAVRAFRTDAMAGDEGMRWLALACRSAHDIWDFDSWRVLATRHVQLARDAGALSVLVLALGMRASVHLFAGELDAADSLVEELQAIVEATGRTRSPYTGLVLAAWRGRGADVSRLIDATTPAAVAQCDGQWLTAVHWANAVLSNGIGRYEDALAAAELAAGYPQEQAISQWALPELIEAAVRCGRPECATGAMRRLTETTRACGLNWGLGVEAYSRALLSDGEAAEPLHREAIVRLSRAGVGARLARAHLVYGEWLRRENRRLDAREQLRTAYRMLGDMGIAAFAERARRELVATGETVRRRTDETRDELTAQEAQIARLAGDGWTNPEIGAQLFISPRTVEWHLRKIFGKLDISSRKELGAALPEAKHKAVPV